MPLTITTHSVFTLPQSRIELDSGQLYGRMSLLGFYAYSLLPPLPLQVQELARELDVDRSVVLAWFKKFSLRSLR